MTLSTIIAGLGSLVTIASLAANFVPPATKLGRALHWVAFNGRGMQNAVAKMTDSATASPSAPLPAPIPILPPGTSPTDPLAALLASRDSIIRQASHLMDALVELQKVVQVGHERLKVLAQQTGVPAPSSAAPSATNVAYVGTEEQPSGLMTVPATK